MFYALKCEMLNGHLPTESVQFEILIIFKNHLKTSQLGILLGQPMGEQDLILNIPLVYTIQ